MDQRGAATAGLEAEKPAGIESRQAQRAFSLSMVVSGIRCALTYIVLPFVTPFLGLAPGVGPTLGIVIGVVAVAANAVSLSRFWRLRHPWRRPVTVLHFAVIGLLLVLITFDVVALANRGS